MKIFFDSVPFFLINASMRALALCVLALYVPPFGISTHDTRSFREFLNPKRKQTMLETMLSITSVFPCS
uniref:Putative secreted protein n=1 Tax=Anopheles darlingi TaxID=43151 RepID=A0A2M4DCT4_ANODA